VAVEHPVTPSVRFWHLAERLSPGSTNLGRDRIAPPGLDTAALRQALDLVVARHEMLRSAIRRSRQRHGGWRALYLDYTIVPGAPTPPTITELEALDDSWSERVPFNLARPPLLGVRVAPYEDRVLVGLRVPHCATDGWSMELIWRDLARFYDCVSRGVEPDLTPVPGFGERARRQFEAREAGDLDRHLRFWEQHLGGATSPALPPVPAGRQKDAVMTQVARAPTVADEDAVRLIARRHRVTAFSVVMAAYLTALHRVFSWDEIVLQVAMLNRSADEHEIVGSFATVGLLRFPQVGDQPFEQLLRQAFTSVAQGMSHGSVTAAEALDPAGWEQLLTSQVAIRGEATAAAEDLFGWARPAAPPPQRRTMGGTETDVVVEVVTRGPQTELSLTVSLRTVTEERAEALLQELVSVLGSAAGA